MWWQRLELNCEREESAHRYQVPNLTRVDPTTLTKPTVNSENDQVYKQGHIYIVYVYKFIIENYVKLRTYNMTEKELHRAKQLATCYMLMSCLAYFRPWRWKRYSSETSADFQLTARRYIPEDRTIQKTRISGKTAKVKVTLRLPVYRQISTSWRQAPWDPRPEIFFFNWILAVLVLMWHPPWREDGVCRLKLLLVLASAVILRSESHGAHYHILLDPRYTQPGGPGPRIYIPQEQVSPVIPPGTGFLFRRLVRLAGLRCGYSNPLPHGPHRKLSVEQLCYYSYTKYTVFNAKTVYFVYEVYMNATGCLNIKFCYCCVCILCCGNVFTEPLPRKVRRLQRHTNWWEVFMKYAAEMGLGAMMYISSFVKTR
jgi:hypothetical protein